MTLVFAWADDVISSRSCAVKLLQTSTASFSHGSPIPGRDLTLNDKELKIENQRNLPGPQPSLVLNRMPAEIVSNTRRRASPAESGVPALKAALSTINSIAYTRIRITSLAEPNLYFFITQSSRFDQTGERIQKSLMTLITRTQFWRVLALAWNHLARRRSASECKQSLVFRRPSLIAAASFMSTSLPGWQSLTR